MVRGINRLSPHLIEESRHSVGILPKVCYEAVLVGQVHRLGPLSMGHMVHGAVY